MQIAVILSEDKAAVLTIERRVNIDVVKSKFPEIIERRLVDEYKDIELSTMPGAVKAVVFEIKIYRENYEVPHCIKLDWREVNKLMEALQEEKTKLELKPYTFADFDSDMDGDWR